MAPPPPLLCDDATAQILLRLPPDEPEFLFRAALICKHWLRIICDPGFLRSYRAFHGVPPLLGTFRRIQDSDEAHLSPRLTPTSAVPAFPHPDKGPGDHFHLGHVLDCCHGRVLIDVPFDCAPNLLVWDPVIGDHHEVPKPHVFHSWYSAAVFCVADGCDHLNHGGPFRVAYVIPPGRHKLIYAGVYASKAGLWSTATSCFYNRDYTSTDTCTTRGALIGDQIHFILTWSNGHTHTWGADIVRYEWSENCLSSIYLKPSLVEGRWPSLIMMEDASLGLAHTKDSSLYLVSRKVNAEGIAEWMQCRVIELDRAMPMVQPHRASHVVGYAEGVDVIFVGTVVGLFAFELKSERVRKVEKGHQCGNAVMPYMSFYTPEHSRTLSSLARRH